MPSASRFALLRDTVRSHPVVVASTAASAGVLLGGFVAFQLLAPTHPRADNAAAVQPALASTSEAKPAPETKPVAETTGSAPAGERTASADCEKETWPHLSPPCVEEMRAKNRVRVISTDKLDKQTVTAIQSAPPAPEPAPAAPAPAAPAIASAAPVSPPPSPPVDLNAAPSVVFGAPNSAPAALTSAAPQPSQPAAEPEPKKEKRVATKSKRKPKTEPRAPAKQESDDDDETPSTTASVDSDSDDRVSEGRSNRRIDRRVERRRIVERRGEQEYDVPADNGNGERRVIVIRRGGGLFQGLFGD